MCIMFRAKSIIGFFKFPLCGVLISSHLHKMVEEASRELKIVKGFLKRANADIADINISCLLNGQKHRIEGGEA